MTDIQNLKARLREDISDDLAQIMLDDAEALALGYMHRTTLPDECKNAVLRLAAVLYARLGMEGEASRTEGGVSVSVEMMPDDIKTQLRMYRLASTGGV